MPADCAGTRVAAQPYTMLHSGCAWPLGAFDAALVAQTYAGRPMTTHHVLEIDRPLPIEQWQRAVEAWVEHFPELRSVLVFAPRLQRVVGDVDPAVIRARVELDHDESTSALEHWINRPIDLEQPCPFRVRIAPGQLAAQSVTFSLHHSLTDGHGALMLFDALLELVQGGAVAPRSTHWPEAAALVRPQMPWRDLWRRAAMLTRPCVAVRDLVDAGAATGHRLTVRALAAARWDALGRRARAYGVSRNTLLWQTAARTVATMPMLGSASAPTRVLAAVDLRAELGVADDALRNCIGTIEHELDGDDSVEGLQRLHAALRRQMTAPLALATPVLLGKLVEHLPPRIARSIFRWVDSQRWPNTHTILLSHIRPRMPRCWPVDLQPRRLWCTSLLPRKPGLGLTVTTMGDDVTIAASWRADALRRTTVEEFLTRWSSAMTEPLEAHDESTLRRAASI